MVPRKRILTEFGIAPTSHLVPKAGQRSIELLWEISQHVEDGLAQKCCKYLWPPGYDSK